MKSIKLMYIDELGALACLEEYNIPFGEGDLSDIEVEALANFYWSKNWIAPEWRAHFYVTDYRTKEDLAKADEEFEAELDAIIDEYGLEEDDWETAREIWIDNKRFEDWI